MPSTPKFIPLIALVGVACIGLGVYQIFGSGGNRQIAGQPQVSPTVPVWDDSKVNEGVNLPVNARYVWVDTNTHLRKGDAINIEARGEISVAPPGDGAYMLVGPDGWGYIPSFSCGKDLCRYKYRENTSLGCLIGKIGNGQPFKVGNHTTMVVQNEGSLFFGVNDAVSNSDGTPLSDSQAEEIMYSNNQGKFAVKVGILRAR